MLNRPSNILVVFLEGEDGFPAIVQANDSGEASSPVQEKEELEAEF